MPLAAALEGLHGRRMLPSFSLAILSLALAMDAFAVALAQGACGRASASDAIKIGGAFGVAQGVMPFIGWLLGAAFMSFVSEIDHWIALVLLTFLGIRMLLEARKLEEGPKAVLVGWALFTAAFATSVDALAAGITLPTFGLPVGIACVAIGATTFVLCVGGVLGGKMLGARIGKWADVAGGLMLIGLGVKIFVQHQFFGG